MFYHLANKKPPILCQYNSIYVDKKICMFKQKSQQPDSLKTATPLSKRVAVNEILIFNTWSDLLLRKHKVRRQWQPLDFLLTEW